MTTGSSPPWGAKVALLLSAGGLPLSTRVRPADCGSVRCARSAARSSLSQSVVRRDCRLASHRSPSACFATLVWKASGDPKRGERSDPVAPRARTVGREPATRAAATPKGHSGTRTPTDLIPPSRKRGGRSFGAALSEVAIARTPTSSAGLATGQAMSRSPIGGSPVPGLTAALWCSRYALRGL